MEYKADEKTISYVDEVLKRNNLDNSWLNEYNYFKLSIALENAALEMDKGTQNFSDWDDCEDAYINPAYAEEYEIGSGCYERACNDFALYDSPEEEHNRDSGFY